jgi:hypothetical protein
MTGHRESMTGISAPHAAQCAPLIDALRIYNSVDTCYTASTVHSDANYKVNKMVRGLIGTALTVVVIVVVLRLLGVL